MSDRYENSNEKQKIIILKTIFGNDVEIEENKEVLDFLYEMYVRDSLDDEFLVDGAALWCEKATDAPRYIDGQCFCVDKRPQSRLTVDRRMKSNGLSFAVITDAQKGMNIFPFGNCTCELTEPEKSLLKSIPEARTEGICKYLMHLNDCWDIFPRLEGYKYIDGCPAINMRARLFCNRKGAFIYPVTSGQTRRNGDLPLYAMDIDEAEFAVKNNLTERQMGIFIKIQQYFEENSDLETGNVVFAFEGLGSYSGPQNSDHPQGQFGAIFILYQDGKPIYMSDKCSTLPDNIGPATIEDGVYYAVYKLHRGAYQALQLWTSEKEHWVVAHYHDGNGDIRNATEINMHAAGELKDHSANPWSIGCVTIAISDYYDFGVKAGFIEPRPGVYDQNYDQIRTLNGINLNEYESWGHVVVNRDFMEITEKRKFLYEDNDNENN